MWRRWRIRRWRIRRRMRERRKIEEERWCLVWSSLLSSGEISIKTPLHTFSLWDATPPPPQGSMGAVGLRKARVWFHQLKQLWFAEDSGSWCHLKSCTLSLLNLLLSRSSCGWLIFRCLLRPRSALSWLRPLSHLKLALRLVSRVWLWFRLSGQHKAQVKVGVTRRGVMDRPVRVAAIVLETRVRVHMTHWAKSSPLAAAELVTWPGAHVHVRWTLLPKQRNKELLLLWIIITNNNNSSNNNTNNNRNTVIQQ